MIKAYLDTNIFLTYLNVETSNSELVIELADQGAYTAVISFHTTNELMHNIKSRYPKNVAGWMFAFIWSIHGIQFVQKEEIDALKGLYSDLITDMDDVPHIHAYFARECDYFVTTDRRLMEMKINEKVNFKNPKSFLRIIGVDGHDTADGI
ncbi:MAG TPA: PIN domain-containing protein [Methanosarcinales archaeon]|nr:PIN domain-containing protein [Methanosarcinales archaeon]